MTTRDKLEQGEIIYQSGRKAGIRKVFQWLSEQPKEDVCGGMKILVAIDRWQDKLKEWGINEHKDRP